MSEGLSSKVNYLSRGFKTNLAYIDICSDHLAGVLLSRIKYWYMPSEKSGTTKLRVKKEGRLWLVKKRDDWYEEIRITPKQYDRAIKILQSLNLVELKKFRFNGSPMIHIRLNEELLDELLENEYQKFIQEALKNEIEENGTLPLGKNVEPQDFIRSNLPIRENGTLPLGKNEIDEKGKTLTSTTTSTINNKKNTPTKVVAAPKNLFLDFVYLTDEEYQKLCTLFSKEQTDDMIEELNNYLANTKKKYLSHYHTLRKWIKNKTSSPSTPVRKQKQVHEPKFTVPNAEETKQKLDEVKPSTMSDEKRKEMMKRLDEARQKLLRGEKIEGTSQVD